MHIYELQNYDRMKNNCFIKNRLMTFTFFYFKNRYLHLILDDKGKKKTFQDMEDIVAQNDVGTTNCINTDYKERLDY